MICWEINSTERSIRSVELPDIPEGYGDDPRLLSEETGDVVYVERNSEADCGFVVEGIRSPIIGVAYVVGTNEAGDDVPPKAAYDSLVESIDFGQCRDGMFFGERHVRAIQ